MATATELKMRVITPERTLLEQSAKKVTFQGIDGSYGILPNHAPLGQARRDIVRRDQLATGDNHDRLGQRRS